MFALKRLGKLQPCSRKVCSCAEEMRRTILRIPLTEKEEEESHRRIIQLESQYKPCFESRKRFDCKE